MMATVTPAVLEAVAGNGVRLVALGLSAIAAAWSTRLDLLFTESDER